MPNFACPKVQRHLRNHLCSGSRTILCPSPPFPASSVVARREIERERESERERLGEKEKEDEQKVTSFPLDRR